MSSSTFLADAATRPDLFVWNGPIPCDVLEEWIAEHALSGRIPGDLIKLWEATGGGDFLESETVLGPFADAALGDDFLSTNRDLHLRGLADHLLVFHVGTFTGVADTNTGMFLELDNRDFQVVRRHESFEDWYVNGIRRELGPRYGLS